MQYHVGHDSWDGKTLSCPDLKKTLRLLHVQLLPATVKKKETNQKQKQRQKQESKPKQQHKNETKPKNPKQNKKT